MCIDLATILPNISSLERTGFLFGAGTSVEAGYPMMAELTRKVIGALASDERVLLDDALKVSGSGVAYNDSEAVPNIEELADLVMVHSINSHDARYSTLENRLRELVVQEILSVKTPQLDNHVQFFQALSKRTFGCQRTVWIFTTNYDLLFEIAAAKVGVCVENGFSGCIERFFNPDQFEAISGKISSNHFTPTNQLIVKLIKLHGSISWISENNQIFERHPDAITERDNRIMVLPRRKKIMETLVPPYNSLFTYMNKILGKECKYLCSCGFSFGDEHINQHIIPALKSGHVRLFALNESEPKGIAEFKNLTSFSHSYADNVPKEGKSNSSTDIWKFSKFVNLF
jgi:hypothetical protein